MREELCLYVPGIDVVVVGVALVLQDVDEAGTGQEESDHLGQQLGKSDGGRFLEQSHIDLQVTQYTMTYSVCIIYDILCIKPYVWKV